MSESAWQKYKQKMGDTRPWDILNPNEPRANDEESNERLEICKQCPEFISATTQCKQCGCIMKLKTKLAEAECPLKKWDKLNYDTTSKIFINIPSYKDPELWLTITDFLDNAKYPERIYFGVTDQVADVQLETAEYYKIKENAKYLNVQFDIIEAGSLIGCQPGRKNSHKFYNNEEYYLNMDSHMRTVKDWDVKIIKDFNETEKKMGKGVYTGYVNTYELHDDMTHTINEYPDIPVYFMSDSNITSFKNNGIVQLTPTYRNYQRESYSPYISGHFFFTRGEYVKKIGFVDQIVFTEEEIFMALRYFTAGYNLYIPKNNYVFHHYGRKNRELIWEDFPEKFYPAADKSKDFALDIILNNVINEEYGLFKERTISEFEKYSGINFKDREPGEKMLKGLEPSFDPIVYN